MTQPPFHTFVEYDRIKEPLCLSFFETVLRLQIEDDPHGHVSYKDIMPAMHIGRERLQRVLDCIGRNWLYFKIEKGVHAHSLQYRRQPLPSKDREHAARPTLQADQPQ